MKQARNLTNWGSKLALASLLLLAGQTLTAQQGPPAGGFDPQQMRQRMLQQLRDQFEVADDAEWKAISERITKVMDARRAASIGGRMGGGGPFVGPGGGPPPNAGGQGGPGGQATQGGPPGGANNGPGGFGGGPGPNGPPPGGMIREPNPELEALQKAVEAKAPSAELKSKMADLRAARAKKQAELENAREELRQLLSARQEAVATIMGLL